MLSYPLDLAMSNAVWPSLVRAAVDVFPDKRTFTDSASPRRVQM
jgi:hypothetical protein